uniref:Specificity protein 1 n=1 Tax=Urechis unicinctus TaxID=6432 RepID=A0A1B1CUQ9_UREUN|nr:specificity protein 1 [Urechis unicinctus]
MKPEQERLTTVLKDTISLLCKNSLSYDKQVTVQGLIAVTVDKGEVMVIQVNDSVGVPDYEPCVTCGHAKSPLPDNNTSRKRKHSLSDTRDSSIKSRRHDHSSPSVLSVSPTSKFNNDDDSYSGVDVKTGGASDSEDEDLIFIDAEIKSEALDYDYSKTSGQDSVGHSMGDNQYITGVMDNSQMAAITTKGMPTDTQGMSQWPSLDGSHPSTASGITPPTVDRNTVTADLTKMVGVGYDDSDNIRPYVCTWLGCSARFTLSRNLRQHQEIHLGEKRLQCPYCPYRTNRK